MGEWLRYEVLGTVPAPNEHSTNHDCTQSGLDDKSRNEKQQDGQQVIWQESREQIKINGGSPAQCQRERELDQKQEGASRRKRERLFREQGRGEKDGWKGVLTALLHPPSQKAAWSDTVPKNTPHREGTDCTAQCGIQLYALSGPPIFVYTYFHRTHHDLRRSGAHNTLKFLLKERKFKYWLAVSHQSRTFA